VKLELDPRTRLGLAVLYAALVALTRHSAWLAAELCVVLLLVILARQGVLYLRWLRLAGTMAATWFLISLWAFDLPTAIWASLRVMALTSVFFLFFRTTPPEDLGNALVVMGLPYEVAFVMSVSTLFVPVLGRKAQNVVDAQRSRGIPLEPGLRALRHYPALMAPLLIQAFQLADELAEAMEARGFGRPGRTFAREYRMRAVDWLALLGGAVVFITLIWIR
jgi:energy-coupling factor transport system permease protein